MSTKISRRTFLEASGTALVAGAAMAGVATAEEAAAGMPVGPNGMAVGPDAAGLHAWEIAPEAIPADQIVATEDMDAVIVGAGLAGCCAAIAAL